MSGRPFLVHARMGAIAMSAACRPSPPPPDTVVLTVTSSPANNVAVSRASLAGIMLRPGADFPFLEDVRKTSAAPAAR